MKQKIKIASDAKQKSIIEEAIQSSENEQLDLYKAIFGGKGSDCNVAAGRNLRTEAGVQMAAAAYDKTGQFLQAAL